MWVYPVILSLTSIPNYCLQQGFFVVPSNLTGMDFATLPMTSNNKVNVNTTLHEHERDG